MRETQNTVFWAFVSKNQKPNKAFRRYTSKYWPLFKKNSKVYFLPEKLSFLLHTLRVSVNTEYNLN